MISMLRNTYAVCLSAVLWGKWWLKLLYMHILYVRCSCKQVRSVCESHTVCGEFRNQSEAKKGRDGGRLEQHMPWQFITAQTVNLMQHVSQLKTLHATHAITLQYRLVLWKEITPEWCSLKLTEWQSALRVSVLLCKNPKSFTCVLYFCV